MARMIPDYISNECLSSAEAYMFNRLKKELPQEYYVFHSLSLAMHESKIQAEVDFVLLSSNGIMCLEIKGGRVSCKKNTWIYTNRYGKHHYKSESPFRQVTSAMYALRRAVIKEFGENSVQSKITYGYLVVFPDVSFEITSPEWDPERIVDKKIRSTDLLTIIENKYEYSISERKRVSKDTIPLLSEDDIEKFRNFLRGEFETVVPLHIRVDDISKRRISLSQEQYEVLDQVSDNPRNLIYGGAGTGKTLVATEKFRRNIRTGLKTLLLCYNRNLARRIRKQLFDEKLPIESLNVYNIHSYALKILYEKNIINKSQTEFDDKFLNEDLLQLFIEYLDNNGNELSFDELIIDEGQDLRDLRHIKIISKLLKGGISDGKWYWFEDHNQNIFNVNQLSGPEEFTSVFSKYHLTYNFRNTYPISLYTSLLTDRRLEKNKIMEGPGVKIEYYENPDEQKIALKKLVKDFLAQGIAVEDILILSRLTEKKSVINDMVNISGVPLRNYSNFPEDRGSIKYSTIQSFKGLESKAVIVTDIDSIDSDEFKNLYYVGLTRANVLLALCMHQKNKIVIENNADRLGRTLFNS